jgi:fructose-1,6-bisphosphatase/inositol monophosphatase family enzyme
MPPDAGLAYAEEVRVALALAREAGERAVRAQTGPLDITHKADRSLVTAVDRDLDAFLVGALRARFPDDAVVGEESSGVVAAGPEGAARCWFVDPIDGTTNFALGLGEFTVVVGLAAADRPVAGAVVEPVGQVAFWAARDAGFVQRGAAAPAPLRVSRHDALRGARMVRAITRRASATEQHLARYGVPPPERVGSLALRICLVARGAADFTYSTEFRGGPWDLCGPLAILEAAGGRATDLEGRPLRVGRRAPAPRSLVISNGRLHEAVVAALASRK